MPESAYSDADIEAAIASLTEPGRLRAAQELLGQAAPRLHRILDDALSEGGWFDSAHAQAVREATGIDDPAARVTAVRTLIAEETRLGMFVGVAVGFELARELGYAGPGSEAGPAPDAGASPEAGAAPDPETGAGLAPETTTKED